MYPVSLLRRPTHTQVPRPFGSFLCTRKERQRSALSSLPMESARLSTGLRNTGLAGLRCNAKGPHCCNEKTLCLLFILGTLTCRLSLPSRRPTTEAARQTYKLPPERYLGFSELQGPFGLSPGIMSLKPFSPRRTPLAPKFYQGRSSVLLESLLVGQKLQVHVLGSILILVTESEEHSFPSGRAESAASKCPETECGCSCSLHK